MRLNDIAFQFVSRIPFIGDVPILAKAIVKSGGHAFKKEWGHAGAEILSGTFQFIGDDLIPIVGRDLGHELARVIVRKIGGPKYLPERSLLFGAFLGGRKPRAPTHGNGN